MATLAPVPRQNFLVEPSRYLTPVWFDWFNTLRAIVFALNGSVRIGPGSPNGVVVGTVGNLWLRTDGGASSTLYVKESGNQTNLGWVAK